MNRSLRSKLARSFVFAFVVAGCNTILDNEPGQPEPGAPTDVTPTLPTDDGGSDLPAIPKGGEQPGEDAAAPPDDPDAGSGPLCAPGQRMCHGFCVGVADPTYGCGGPGCEPCKTSHGSSACQADKCIVQTCDRGYADCNQNPADGCEVDLSKATSCGSCNAVCPAGSPVCAPSGNTFQCTTGCTPDAPLLCGNECVAPQTSVNHCGGCNARCPDVENGEVACQGGACTFTCKPSYHACAGKCAVNTDPLACGAACTVCPVPANAAATCQANTCGFQCNAGFGNCNQDPADGCESDFATDPLNCGGCGKSCNGGTCKAGACTPPPDAGP